MIGKSTRANSNSTKEKKNLIVLSLLKLLYTSSRFLYFIQFLFFENSAHMIIFVVPFSLPSITMFKLHYICNNKMKADGLQVRRWKIWNTLITSFEVFFKTTTGVMDVSHHFLLNPHGQCQVNVRFLTVVQFKENWVGWDFSNNHFNDTPTGRWMI